MQGLTEADASASLRARRWDVIILGGALPGLVTAARLGLDGLRVLVVEEEAAAGLYPGLREPFLIPGSMAGGVLDACLKALTVPLIERRKLEPDPVALQIVLPEIRISVGNPITTAEEIVAWGLAKPDVAKGLVRAIAEAGVAERTAMLDAAVIKGAAPRGGPRPAGMPRAARHGRGLPIEVASPPAALRPLLDARVRALSNLAELVPPPEARGRLLGAALEGTASYRTAEGFLRGCLRRRIQNLFGEFRTLPGRFDLVAMGGHPGIAAPGMTDLWVGRVLVLNAPRGCIAPALRELGGEPPEVFSAPPPTRRRVAVHLRIRRSVLPEAMASRVVVLRDPARPADGLNVVTLSIFPAAQPGSDRVDLIASCVVPEADAREQAVQIEAALVDQVASLMPFSEGQLAREPIPRARWDDDSALCDPKLGEGWPVEAEIRLSSKPAIYGLPREALAALGMEGDLLLGWRAGELIRSELP